MTIESSSRGRRGDRMKIALISPKGPLYRHRGLGKHVAIRTDSSQGLKDVIIDLYPRNRTIVIDADQQIP